MKLLAIIFGVLGLLFIMNGIFFGELMSNILMSLIFFSCGIVFWRNSNDEPLYTGSKEAPSETFRKNQEMIKRIKQKNKSL